MCPLPFSDQSASAAALRAPHDQHAPRGASWSCASSPHPVRARDDSQRARCGHLFIIMTDRSIAGDSSSPESNDGGRSTSPEFGEMLDTAPSQSTDTDAPRRRRRRRKKPADESPTKGEPGDKETSSKGDGRRRRSRGRRQGAASEEAEQTFTIASTISAVSPAPLASSLKKNDV